MRAALAIVFFLSAVAATTCAAMASHCSFNAGSPAAMTFPNYDTISATSVTATTTIQYTCSGNAALTMTADAGLNGTVCNREMKDPVSGDLLPYTLSLSASHAPIFGDGTGGTQTYSTNPPNNTTVSVTVYGIINAAIAGGAGDVHAGSYSDTVTVTMTF